ncbi:MAG: hypothetical protein EON95_07410 [Caulobacteraceae bacterium]|nr:TorF family putative porin [Caulobacter sp.]RYF93869.1 MAG: hypothetical protein EON95_07410 [Caulobacteraceae bacterium]
MSKLALLIISAATLAVTASASQAADVSGQVGLASQYLGKGLGKSDEEPALFGSGRWNVAEGFYASAFASQAASSRGADAEVILTGGYEHEFGEVAVDVQVMRREMTGETNGVDSAYWEYQADVSRDFGERFSARLRVNYSADTYGAADEAWWVEAQGGFKLTPSDKLTVAYAQRRLDRGADYDAWNIGVKHKFNKTVSADLRWYDTDGHDLGERYEGRLVAALTLSF